ncbi:hypothetical protein LWI28_012250 [Acer negundo]|uniref:Uncharacterized protein n=1 Tax=Acer negundo TaxID=4023 RepID=A0AAD5NNE8_ACENE|nr:hypothetical protein LWI28_012250 [Acer negundo]
MSWWRVEPSHPFHAGGLPFLAGPQLQLQNIFNLHVAQMLRVVIHVMMVHHDQLQGLPFLMQGIDYTP